jgi:hypothetical protein
VPITFTTFLSQVIKAFRFFIFDAALQKVCYKAICTRFCAFFLFLHLSQPPVQYLPSRNPSAPIYTSPPLSLLALPIAKQRSNFGQTFSKSLLIKLFLKVL